MFGVLSSGTVHFLCQMHVTAGEMFFAQMSKSNSRTFQELSRTIRRIFKENYINQKQHFYRHIRKSYQIRGAGSKLKVEGHELLREARETFF